MTFIRYIFFTFLSFTLVLSCSEKKKEDVVNLSDLIPSSKRYKEGGLIKEKEVKSISFMDSVPNSYKCIFDSLNLSHDSIHPLDLKLFADRFESKSKFKFFWKIGTDSISFMDWTFKDSLKTTTAFYNLLDCFGPKCKTIEIGQKINFQKRSFLLLVNDKHMVIVDSDKKIDQLVWLKLLKDQGFGENWKYIVIQPKKGKASWVSLKNEEFKEIGLK